VGRIQARRGEEESMCSDSVLLGAYGRERRCTMRLYHFHLHLPLPHFDLEFP